MQHPSRFLKLLIIGACFMGQLQAMMLKPMLLPTKLVHRRLGIYEENEKFTFPPAPQPTPLERQMIDEAFDNRLTEEKLKKYLTNDDFDINAQHDTMHITALMYAAMQNDIKLVQLLLQYGAQVNEQNDEGMTALVLAIINNENNEALPLIKLLLAHGADPRLHDARGITSLMMAAEESSEVVQLLLATHQVAIEAQDQYGRTALMKAAANPAIFKLIIAHGADTDARDFYGWTGLMHALEYKNPAQAIVTFLDAGANPTLRSYDEKIIAEKLKNDPLYADEDKEFIERAIKRLANKTFYNLIKPLGAQDIRILKALTSNEQRRQMQEKLVLEHTHLIPNLANIVLEYTPAPPTTKFLEEEEEKKSSVEQEIKSSDENKKTCCVIC